MEQIEQALRLDRLEEGVRALSERIDPVTIPISTFAPQPYEVLRPIPVLIRPDGEEFVASFVEANVNASGETQQEAFENVKSLILDAFDSLRSHPPEKLGPEPARRLAVLRDFIRAA
jgi:predicted RNase H-like HicB family nuclease